MLEGKRDVSLWNDLDWIEAHYDELARLHAGRWVAVRDGVVVGDGVFLADLKDRCRSIFPQPAYRLIYAVEDES